jgi:hypothetical protein
MEKNIKQVIDTMLIFFCEIQVILGRSIQRARHGQLDRDHGIVWLFLLGDVGISDEATQRLAKIRIPIDHKCALVIGRE